MITWITNVTLHINGKFTYSIVVATVPRNGRLKAFTEMIIYQLLISEFSLTTKKDKVMANVSKRAIVG